jgi:hypothetical protein
LFITAGEGCLGNTNQNIIVRSPTDERRIELAVSSKYALECVVQREVFYLGRGGIEDQGRFRGISFAVISPNGELDQKLSSAMRPADDAHAHSLVLKAVFLIDKLIVASAFGIKELCFVFAELTAIRNGRGLRGYLGIGEPSSGLHDRRLLSSGLEAGASPAFPTAHGRGGAVLTMYGNRNKQPRTQDKEEFAAAAHSLLNNT